MKVCNIAAGLVALALTMSASAQDFPPPIQGPFGLNYYPFTQSGYQQGTIYGWFWGTDENGDGYLTTPELSTFQFSFLANNGDSYQSLAVSVSDMFANGGGFSFKLDGPFLGDDDGEFIAAGVGGTHTAGFSYTSGPNGGVFATTHAGWSFDSDTTISLVDVLPVVLIPEPAIYALLFSGLVAIGTASRKRKGAEAS